ncbi:MAG: hypothetical protein ACTSYB_17740 [Candidatus Helarchaeota archaeon]
MKIKYKQILLSGFLLGIFFGIFFTSPIVQAVEIYNPSTDPNNPFIFSVDVVFTKSSLSWSGTTTWYHKVYLFPNKIYLFYWGSYTADLTFKMGKEDSSSLLFIKTGDWTNGPGVSALLIIEVSEPDYYTLNITTSDNSGNIGFSAVGFFEIKELILGQTMYGPNFPSNHVTFAYYYIDGGKKYSQQCCVFSKYFVFGTSGGTRVVDVTPNDDWSFSDTPTQIGLSDRFIIYSYSSNILPITEQFNVPFMQEYILWISIIITILFCYLCRRRKWNTLLLP